MSQMLGNSWPLIWFWCCSRFFMNSFLSPAEPTSHASLFSFLLLIDNWRPKLIFALKEVDEHLLLSSAVAVRVRSSLRDRTRGDKTQPENHSANVQLNQINELKETKRLWRTTPHVTPSIIWTWKLLVVEHFTVLMLQSHLVCWVGNCLEWIRSEKQFLTKC